MKTMPLSVKPRVASGKGGARQLRAAGMIPATFYGEQTNPATLAVNSREFGNVLKKSSSENVIVDLSVEGSKAELALVKDVQHDPISGDVIHIDFQHISANKPIRVTVPIRVTGVADGVKNFGGILQHSAREVEVEALPSVIPDYIDLDVTNLGIHQAIHASDIALEGVTIVTAADQTIVSVVPPTVVKEVTPGAPAEGAAETAAGEPEVIGEKEREARAAEKDKGGDEKKEKK
jgi:large subunit ribosomal protein L25